MKRWEVTLIVNGELVKHVVRAGDLDAALAKASRAYNVETIVARVTRLGSGHDR